MNRTLILIDPKREEVEPIDWTSIGFVVEELSELYQIARESQVDVILIDDTRIELKPSVATKLRRYNGQMEMWLLTGDDYYENYETDYIDGLLPRSLGQTKIAQKLKQILHSKDLLEQYEMVGRSARMKAIAETIERVAITDIPILVEGPSGSGKELVAKALHRYSERQGKPFVAINCGALAEGLLESELFGHERGAFTGSVSKREGLFHKASGGTMFLDEIGETKPDMQVKLLRVLEDGTYYPVGSSTARRADVRVVAATNRDLAAAIAERSFREDLYFRIGVVKIVLPPLLERKGDIQPLLAHFWVGYPEMQYSDAALDLLIKYDWPGNIRQLKNFTDRMIALKPTGLIETDDVESFLEEQHAQRDNLPVSTGRTVEEAGQELIYRAIMQLGNEVRLLRDLITAHMPGNQELRASGAVPSSPERGNTMEQMEEMLIRQVLDETHGNRKETARRLGIGERTLYRKLKKYDLR
ncbi:MAG: sigma-54 dependent transcriptional regulator [candidate division Zixibacteria bacterium]|nr:sigma-54 dependent transcriptional regulator [candidate division Zixibacteria bacterium]